MEVRLDFLPDVSDVVWELVLKGGLEDPYYWTTMHAIVCVNDRALYPVVIEGSEYAIVPNYQRGQISSGDIDRLEKFMREQGFTRVDY